MSIFSSYKKIFLLGFIIVILIAIPFSVYIAQKRQNIKSKASASTSLSFAPPSTTVKVGETATLDIFLDPGASDPNTANQVSFAKLAIKFDSSKFATISGSLAGTSAMDTTIDEANYGPGTASISLSIGADPTKAISTKTKIATLQLKATGATSPGIPNITFDSTPDAIQILSVDNSSQTSDNVFKLSTTTPATITVTGGSGTSAATTTAPTCTSLIADRATTGNAPYPITFTTAGTDSDGTINKVSFNFGDGQVQDLTTGGGIGTNSVSTQISHSYNVAGTFTAFVTLTDNNSNVSVQQANCSKAITINPAGTLGGTQVNAGGSTPIFTTPSEPIAPTATIAPPAMILPPTGPGEKIIGIGILGGVLTIIGGALLLL